VSPIFVRQDCPEDGRPKNKNVQEELPCLVSDESYQPVRVADQITWRWDVPPVHFCSWPAISGQSCLNNIGDTSASLSLAYILYINNTSPKKQLQASHHALIEFVQELKFSTISTIQQTNILFNNHPSLIHLAPETVRVGLLSLLTQWPLE